MQFPCCLSSYFLAVFLNPSDFDFLLTKGNNNEHVDRSSLLLKFDPLLGHSVPVPCSGNLITEAVNKLNAINNSRLSPPQEEDEQRYLESNDNAFNQEFRDKIPSNTQSSYKDEATLEDGGAKFVDYTNILVNCLEKDKNSKSSNKPKQQKLHITAKSVKV